MKKIRFILSAIVKPRCAIASLLLTLSIVNEVKAQTSIVNL